MRLVNTPPEALRNYRLWAALARVGPWEMAQMRNEVPYQGYQPRISILMPVFDPVRNWLMRALDSVKSQVYPYWELCVCDDGSSQGYVKETLSLYERLDNRIKVRYLDKNAGIVRATNEALSLSSGEFVGMLDHDDELAPNALFEVVRFLQDHPEADLIYSDEDKIDEDGQRVNPHFKVGYSPDLALSANYLNHFSVYRRAILEELGGSREGFDGAQDLELVQRYAERTDKIFHIPKVLYHWRKTAGSTAIGADSKPYTHERARRAIKDALERREVEGVVHDEFSPNIFRIERKIIGEPRMSVIIPAAGQPSPEQVESLRNRTSYPNYEMFAVDVESDTMTALRESGEKEASVRFEQSSLSGLYNAAVRRTGGDYVLILSPDLKAASKGWLENMLQHAQRREVGSVGGKLLRPNRTILQAGLILKNEAEDEDGAVRFYRYGNHGTLGYRHYLTLTRNCSAVSSACMMFRKNVFEEVGGFDEVHFDAEFADVDLCLRMQERGYLIVYTPYAEFTYHAPPRQVPGLGTAEAGYVRERWGKFLDADPYYNPNLAWVPSAPELPRAKHKAPEPNGRQTYSSNPPSKRDPPTRVEAPPRAGVATITSAPKTRANETPAPAAARKVADPRDPVGYPPPFFVVGHGRSGTTWLERTLDTHPEVLCKGSGMFFGREKSLHENLRTLPGSLASSENLKIWHDMRPNYWSGRSFEEDMAGYVKAITDHILSKELKKSGKKIVGDRTPHHVVCLEEIREFCPDSKVIHIIRDGRDVAISNMHAFWNSARDRGGPIDLDPEEIERRDAYLEDRERFLKSGESIFTESRIIHLSKGWNRIVRRGRRDGRSLFGENYFEIHYENLLNNAHPELVQLFGFLGVEWDDSVIERVVEENRFEKKSQGRSRGEEDTTSFLRKGVHGDWKVILNQRDKQVFKEHAGELLIKLGYEKDMNWCLTCVGS